VENIPQLDLRSWRDLVSHRRRLVQQRARPKNALRALLQQEGIVPPRTPGMWTKAGRAWLAALEFRANDAAVQRDALLREIQSLDRQVMMSEAELRRISRESPAILQMVQLRGFGSRTAEAVVASLEEWRRRPT